MSPSSPKSGNLIGLITHLFMPEIKEKKKAMRLKGKERFVFVF